MESKLLFKIEIHPVLIKKFNESETKEMISHYMGFIHGISHLNLKNLYINKNRQSMMNEMLTTLKYNELLPI